MVGLDRGPVSDWIGSLGLGERPPLSFERIGNGQSNLTYLVTDSAGSSWVLRRPPLGDLLASAHDVAREYRVLTALGSAPPPVPAALGLCQDAAVSEAPLLLMEHVEGVVVDRAEVAALMTATAREALARDLPATLAKIHDVDLTATGLDSLSTSDTPYAARQIRRWRGQWERSRTRELPLVDELGERLAAAIPEQRERTLVHGDFHLLNLIVDPATGEVRSVLDWELCTIGDPIADLGGLLAYWWRPGDGGESPSPFSMLRDSPSREQLAAAYAELSGRSLESLGFWHALGLWKIAIIAEGVIRRSLEEPGNAAGTGAPTTAAVEAVARRAVAVATEAGL